MEARAIGSVVGALRKPYGRLIVGSAKSVIGHLEPASGMAGLLKSVLVLREKVIPPNLHLEQPHEDIDLEGLNLNPVTSTVPYPEVPGAAMVGVNSFGFGGANAHVLVREYQAPVETVNVPELGSGDGETLPPLFLSARSGKSLRGLAETYAEMIKNMDASSYASVALSVFYGREHLKTRLAATGKNPAALADGLLDFALDREVPKGIEKPSSIVTGDADLAEGKTAFAFSGNGCQWTGMGGVLLGANKTFADTVARVDACMSPLLGWSILDTLSQEIDAERLRLTEVAQPLIFAIQVGLVDALKEKGVEADAVFGHSVGEVSAAYACGALTLEQASSVMYHRSAMQSRSRGMGRMAAVQLNREQALALPEIQSGEVEIGAVNSPAYVTLTGDEEALKALRTRLKKKTRGLSHARPRLPLSQQAHGGVQGRPAKEPERHQARQGQVRIRVRPGRRRPRGR